jgi:hypothetical protein
MHSYHLNLFLSGTLLGASLPISGLGVMGVLFAIVNFAAFIKEVQKHGNQHPC